MLSLLICVASAALWVRSYWITDVVGRTVPAGDPEYKTYTLHSSSGVLTAGYAELNFGIFEGSGFFRSWIRTDLAGPPEDMWDWRLGYPRGPLAFGTAFLSGSLEERLALWVPHLAVVLITALLPGQRLYRFAQRTIRGRGHHWPDGGTL